MMKVLVVNDYREQGGAEQYAQFLCDQLSARGHQVEFVSIEDTTSHKSYRSSLYDRRGRDDIAAIVEEMEPDLVHVQNTIDISPAFLKMVKKRDVPVTMKIEDVRLFCPKGDLVYKDGEPCENGFSHHCFTTGCICSRMDGVKDQLNSLVNGLAKLPIHHEQIRRHVDVITAPAEYTASWGRRLFGTPVTIIRNPSPFDPIDEPVINDSIPTALFVGKLSRSKGVPELVTAFKSLGDDGITAKLELVGVPDRLSEIASTLKTAEKSESIILRGYIEHSNLQHVYRKADVFVLPSQIAENSPLTILEAMSQGVPVVTTDLGGQRELVKDGSNGYKVPPNDPKALAKALRLILEDENLRRDLSEAALKESRQFERRKHVHRMVRLFEETIESYG